MKFRILGFLEIVGPDGAVELRGAKRRGLLAYLLVHAGQPVTLDRLVEDLWDGQPSSGSAGTVQTYMSQLRKVLAGVGVEIETRPGGYALVIASEDLDAAQFERLCADATADPDATSRLGRLDEALALWRGVPLEEFAGSAWADTEATRLEALHLRALQQRFDALLALDRHHEVIPELEVVVGERSLDERFWAQLMLAYYRAGRQADALRAYQRLRTTLADELGIDPSADVAELERRILDQGPELMPSRRPSQFASTDGPLPEGMVTFLFTDLENSTPLWEEHPEAMKTALARHDAILRKVVEGNGGQIVKTTGDGVLAAFGRAEDAVQAAVEAQGALDAERWDETGPLQARMSLHTGTVETRGGDYFGPTLNRGARLVAAGHGGQIVCSEVTANLMRDAPTGSVQFADLGHHRLRGLDRPERIFQVVHQSLRAEFPPLRAVETARSNLPRQMTTFVGREREIQKLSALVRERSLVTVTGVGGVGKTRLAIEVSAQLVPKFPDGAWICELAPIAARGAVWETLAASLGIPRFRGRDIDEVVLDYLRPKRLLVVLDNCEHVLDAATGAASAILQQCPRVSVLATSREPTGLAGEQVISVAPLEVPAEGTDGDALARTDAVRLFCDRAHDADAEFMLTEHNATAIARLCRRLDGLPLAIELAAARARSLSPGDLLARLDDRFRLLTGGDRAGMERHQTLRTAIDWSYELLAPIERDALNRLSVFAGDFDLPAAEEILSGDDVAPPEAVNILSQLVDKSLVVMEAADTSEARYLLLETIRQYAEGHLKSSGEAPDIRRRHADHYVAVAETAGPHLRGREQLTWATVIARDTDNLRAALKWAIQEPSPDHALRLVAPLLVTGIHIGWTAIDWADEARTTPGAAEHRLFPHVVAYAALGRTMRADLERAAELVADAQQAQESLGTNHLAVSQAAAALATIRADFDEAKRLAEGWLDLARSTGDPYEVVSALVNLGSAFLPEPEDGIPVLEEAVEVARESEIASLLPYALLLLAFYLPAEDSGRALTLLDEAAQVGTLLGDLEAVAQATGVQAEMAWRRRDWREELRAAADAVQLEFELRGAVRFGLHFWRAAEGLVGLGYLEPAGVLWGISDVPYSDPETKERAIEVRAALVEGFGEEGLAALKARGAALDTADAVAYLREETERALSDAGDKRP